MRTSCLGVIEDDTTLATSRITPFEASGHQQIPNQPTRRFQTKPETPPTNKTTRPEDNKTSLGPQTPCSALLYSPRRTNLANPPG